MECPGIGEPHRISIPGDAGAAYCGDMLMKLWMWVNVVIILSVLPLVFISPDGAIAAMTAGGLSTVIRITRKK